MVLAKVSPLLEKEKYKQAIKILNTFRNEAKSSNDTFHEHAEINFVLGNCYSLLGQPQQARNCYLRTIERDDKHIGAWQNLAKTEYELENFPQASDAFFTSYQLSQKTKAAFLYYSGVALLQAEHYQSSLNRFDMLLANHPDDISLQWKESLVYALIHADKPRRALIFMIQLAKGLTGKKQQRWREILLQQYMSLNMRKEALNLVQKLTQEAPTVAIWWKGLAHIQLQCNNYKKALAAMTIYSYLAPMTRDEEKLLADLYMQQGVPGKASIYYEKCAGKKIDSQTALSLIRAYCDLGRQKLALERLNTFAKHLKNQSIEMARGDILYATRQYAKAAATFEYAAKMPGKKKARGYLMAGYSYWQLGDIHNAEKAFTKTIDLKQNLEKEARKALKQLVPYYVKPVKKNKKNSSDAHNRA
jgi:tetratricopeptide (TPR) repeat protein